MTHAAVTARNIVRSLMKLSAGVQGEAPRPMTNFIEGAEDKVFGDPAALGCVDTLIGDVHKDLMHMSEVEFLALFDGYCVEKRSETGDRFVMIAMRRPA